MYIYVSWHIPKLSIIEYKKLLIRTRIKIYSFVRMATFMGIIF